MLSYISAYTEMLVAFHSMKNNLKSLIRKTVKAQGSISCYKKSVTLYSLNS